MNSGGSQQEPADATAAQTTFHVGRARAGDDTSLAWLVERLSPLLLAQAAMRLGADLRRFYEPQDLVHDAWLVTLPRLSELPPRRGRHTPVLLKFLSTAILLRVRNLLRKHTGRADAGPGTSGQPEGLPASQSGIVSRAIRNEARDEVQAALGRLADADREVLLLRGVEQVTNATAAMLTGQSAAGVSKRYSRALTRLRHELPGSVFEELSDE
jgi:RNA polymerase sigma factor (sigma-70 family)